MISGYDIIGDIHGHASQLEALLYKLEYKCIDGVFEHSSRQVLFVGDLIDRGGENKKAVQVVQAMVESNTAKCILGNHELNAIAFHTLNPQGGWIRERSNKNRKQHSAFTTEFDEANQEDLASCLTFFKSLPLFLDLGELRLIHACWHEPLLKDITTLLGEDHCLTEEVIHDSHTRGKVAFEAVDVLLKGHEIQLPGDVTFPDKDGNIRDKMRTKWWINNPQNLEEYSLLSQYLLKQHLGLPIPQEQMIGYPGDAPPLFIGHYWEQGDPVPFANNVACVDYSMGKGRANGGNLVAYRWDGESILKQEKFTKLFD